MNKFKLLSAIAVCVVTACTTSPTGRSQLLLMGNNDVAKMGLSSFDQIKSKEKISTDAKTNAFVQCVAKSITQTIPAKYSATNPGEWEVVVFDSEQVNAFALPGGRIGVYTGILKVTENQDQLAAVIGHEVSHVLSQHSNERLSQETVANTGMSIADKLLKNGTSKSGTMAALGMGVQYGVLMPYSRSHETEADVLGVQLMAQAGFNPVESVKLWKNMAAANNGKAPMEILSTHPSDSTRIQQLQSLLPTVTPMYKTAQSQGIHPQCAG